MKLSSFFTFGAVLMIFLALQGLILYKMFVAPRVFTATEAVMTGEVTEVRVPAQGIVQKVLVKENDTVMENQTLFILTRIVTDSSTQKPYQEDTQILAPGAGIITKLDVRAGMFVQAAQQLATIVDTSPGTLFVSAKIPVEPEDVPRIQAGMSATVRASFLFGGSPVKAMVTTVEPQYDARTKMLTVRLTPLTYPDGVENLPVGLPVEAFVEEARRSNDNIVMSLFSMFFPGSFAEAQ